MKTKSIIAAALLGAASAIGVELAWDPPQANDQVQRTVIQVMDLATSNVVTHSSTGLSLVIPGVASGRVFRAAHSNAFGLSEWTPWRNVPGVVGGFRLVIPLEP